MFGPKTAYRYCVGLALSGAAASVYLLIHHIRLHLGMTEGSSFCSINATFDCDKVALSSYSEFLGIPVAAFGLFYFILWLLVLRSVADKKSETSTWAMLKFIALCGLIPVVILASISVTQLQTICLVCAFTYLVSLLLGAIVTRVQFPEKFTVFQGGAVFLKSLNGSFILSLALTAVGVLFIPTAFLSAYKPIEATVPGESPEDRAVRAWRGERVSAEALRVSDEGPERDFSLGNPNALVTVTTYSDFMCPHCKVMGEFLEKSAKEIPIRVIFKDFPLDKACNRIIEQTFHDQSCKAAMVARCAGLAEPKLFWRAHDLLFAQPTVTPETITKVVGMLRADAPDIESCLQSTAQMVPIQRDIEEAISLRLPGTPGVYVQGKRVEAANAGVILRIISEAGTAAEAEVRRQKSAPSP